MEIDLCQLQQMHQRLPADVVLVMVGRAALALERNGHTSGTRLTVDLQHRASSGPLSWPDADLDLIDQHDSHRITEDGAEAVALAVAHRCRAWRVVRRMQREERADWLLEHVDAGRRRIVALEISGVDRGSIAGRLVEKLSQVSGSRDVDERWASVVGFEEPITALQSA